MAANKAETAFRLPIGDNEFFIRNLSWQHLQKQQQENVNQFASPPQTPAMSEMSSGNVFDDLNLKTFIYYFKSSLEDMF